MNGALPEDLCTIDGLCINTIRTLVIDAVQEANSGHPGAPMGLAPAAYILWTRILKHNPKNPEWFDRDRFVLSGGHASMLLYSLLHLTGYDLSLEDLKHFRQWESKTPGHPEYGHTPGVETTTGPLGQGFANAVGMAMAERHLAAIYNRPGHEIIDHCTYVMCGDGDMMEGITAEAASLAGHLGLAKLICLYDDNKISIEGSTELAFTEDVALRFKAYHWNVLRVEDGNDLDAIFAAIKSAQAQSTQPTLILLRTQIAFGSPNKQGCASSHGEPLGKEEVRLTKRNLGCAEDAFFCISDGVLEVFRRCVKKGNAAELLWQEKVSAYTKAFPDLANNWRDVVGGELPDGWNTGLPDFSTTTAIATRDASGVVLNAIAKSVPSLIGGSADLAPSTKTLITGSHDFQKDRYDGRNIRFGVREHAMGGILSGMALHKGLRLYGATFFVFADYIRPAIRLASLMKLPVIYVLTHDSIAVGEDGPTHQPVEHLASLRAIPGLTVIRPADASETAEAWCRALAITDGPVALVLSRQKLPVLDRTQYGPAEGLSQGAYILADWAGKRDIILIGTGSEVHIALEARRQLAEKGVSARVVSMPSWELFDKTLQEYQDQVLPPDVTARIAVEAGIPMGWEHYVGGHGAVMGIARFGASAPGDLLMEKFGFTAENVAQKAMMLLKEQKR
jgi:transketolase